MKVRLYQLKDKPDVYRPLVLTQLVGAFLDRLSRNADPAELELAVIKSRIHPTTNYLDVYTNAETVMELSLETLFDDMTEKDFDTSDPMLVNLAECARSVALQTLYLTFPEETPA